jgi:G:T-mismatch repair DNA endonuclease (very short patch repair protein)
MKGNKMIRYRIYTEDVNGTADIVKNYFHSFTMYRTAGCFKDHDENSLVIELLLDDIHWLNYIKRVCRDIKLSNHQEEVMLTWDEIEYEMI